MLLMKQLEKHAKALNVEVYAAARTTITAKLIVLCANYGIGRPPEFVVWTFYCWDDKKPAFENGDYFSSQAIGEGTARARAFVKFADRVIEANQ